MKKLFLTLFAFAVIFSACGYQNTNKNNSSSSANAVSKTALNAGSVKLTKDEFLKTVWNYKSSPNEWNYLGTTPAIVDFYADWCGPCKVAGPILDEIGNEYAGKVIVYKIDTDKEKELAQVFGITGIPAFLYIPAKGKPVMMSGIGRSKEETKKMFVDNIEKYLSVKK